MSPGEVDAHAVRRHVAALQEAVRILREHAGTPLETLQTDHDERWTIGRGLQFCAQNALDIATHIAAGEGRGVSDYASAILELGKMVILPPTVDAAESPSRGLLAAASHR